MTPAFTVSNPRWLKVCLMLGFVFFVLLASLFLWAALFETGLGRRLGNAAMAGALLWIALKGLPLLKFMNHQVVVNGETLHIQHGRAQQVIPISRLRSHVSIGWQTVTVCDVDGSQLFAADFHASHAGSLVSLAESVQMRDRILRNEGKPRLTKAQFAVRYAEMERWDRYGTVAFWAWWIGLAVALFLSLSGLAKAHWMTFWGLLTVLGIWAMVAGIRMFLVNGNTAERYGLVCGSCEGGLVGPRGHHAMTTGICSHCGLSPFEP